MPRKRTRPPIVAVFGGAKVDASVKALARKLGQAIAAEGHIVLTGGEEPKCDSVKGCAIQGAVDRSSPWIGVEREAVAKCGPKDHNGFVISFGVGHQRNYLEAYMCDAAIALTGEKGTISELASALSLRRPVAFVGDEWIGGDYDLNADRTKALSTMASDTAKKLESKRKTGVEGHLKRIPRGLLRVQAPDYEYFDSRATADDVVAWIKLVLSGKALKFLFPPMEEFRFIASEYKRWLGQQGGKKVVAE